jgi:hypothetical protein
MQTKFPLLLLSLAALAAASRAQDLLALTADNTLVAFRAAAPGLTAPGVAVSGLQPGEHLLGIDVRPATGQLYGLGSTSRLYRIDARTGAAQPVGAPFATALVGTEFGFDFNPTVDRIRIVSDQGQNLRAHPDTGAVVFVDGTLAYAVGDAGFGSTPAVAGAGYTNSVAGATTTVLYDLDTARDVLVTQVPPNSGSLNTVGALGRDVTAVAGFDIDAVSGVAFAACNTAAAFGTPTQLFRVDLGTGLMTWVGGIGFFANAGSRVRGLCVLPPSPAMDLVALLDGDRLLPFDAASPWLAGVPLAVTGLQPGESLLGIDFRPATGELYGLGSTSRLYRIDAANGAAVAVGGGAFTPALAGTAFGFDFNPTVDRIRVVSDLDQNLRLHPDTGVVVATDGSLAFAPTDPNAGQDPVAVASAYTNTLPGASTTLLYDLDVERDVLVTQVPPNSGVLNTVGGLGVDATAVAGFDIAPGSGFAWAVLETGNGSALYAIDLASGAATHAGVIGATQALGVRVRGLAARTVPGLRLQGLATAGCGGAATVGALGVPAAGSGTFALLACGAQPTTWGFFALSLGLVPTPVTFGGLAIHVDAAQFLATTPVTTTAAGDARLAMPLWNGLAGAQLGVQFLAMDTCGPMGLLSTSGLSIGVQ